MVTVTDTSGIDRFFDAIDSVIDKTDRVLNRANYTEEQLEAKRAKRADPIDAHSVKVNKTATPASSSTALATRRFRIVEALDSESGVAVFVVTNGHARAECTTRELAEKILRGLETAP